MHHLNSAPLDPGTEVVIAPPGLFLLLVREHLKGEIEVCSQNVFDKGNGAFTGEISAEQLSDSKIGWTLCGHSERRVILGEKDDVRDSFQSCQAGRKRGFGWRRWMDVLERKEDESKWKKRNGADFSLLECSSLRVRRRQRSMEAWGSYCAVEKHSR